MYYAIAGLFLSAFLFCYLLIPVFEKFAKNRRFVTGHSPQRIDPRRIPYFGGPAMFLVFFATSIAGSFIFSSSIDKNKFFLFFLSALIIMFFGLYDDIKELTPAKKLIAQCIGAVFLIMFVMRTQIIYLGGAVNIGISLLWIIALTNALNLLDILDGLAGGISLINIFSFLVYGILTENNFILLSAPALLGVLCAFLRYNLPPARIFMGDAGSQFLGFCQAVMAISLSFAPAGHEVGLVVPLVILSVPIFDMMFVILMRFWQKKSIFLKSNDHFVFRMLRMGISGKAILKIMLGISLFTNLCAILIFKVSNLIGIMVFIFLLGLLFLFGFKLSRLEMEQ